MNEIVLENSEQVINRVADSIIALANQCIANNGKFTLALSGGNTPKLLYKQLINGNYLNKLDLSKIFIYFSDERYVSPDDDRSNYGLADKYLLTKLDIPEKNIFPVNTSFQDVKESAKIYQATIQSNIACNNSKIPEFDLIILGMGTDGHTASLFPKSELLSTSLLVGSCFHQETKTHRITFTLPLINAANNIFIIALGIEKFIILKDIKNLENNNQVKYPIQNVRPNGELTWFIDEAAKIGV